MKSKLSKEMLLVLMQVKCCPICGQSRGFGGGTFIEDKRFKGKITEMGARHTTSALTQRRVTDKAVQIECHICAFRFSFQWRTLRNSILQRIKNTKIQGEIDFYKNLAHYIEDFLAFPPENFDTEYKTIISKEKVHKWD